MLRKFLSLARFSVKEKAFTLQNNLKVCMSTQFDLSLINMVFEGYLNDKVYDEISHAPQQENQMVIQQINQILTKQQKDHELVTNLIYYFESIQGIENHNENARQLMYLNFDEYSSIALLLFYSEKIELFNEFKQKLKSLTLLQKLIIMSCENEEINLSKVEIQELYGYQGKLRAYALLFISKYENVTEKIEYSCLPHILLMQKHQCDYILKQWLLQIRTIPLLQLVKLLQQLQKFENSELLKQLAKNLYMERIEIKQNKFFDRRILKYFIDLLSKCECFDDYHVHANLISRYINLQPNKWESPMRSIYIDLSRLSVKDNQVYTKFQQLFLTPQYINSITYLELYLTQKITAEQVFIIQLFKLRVAEDYYHRYLKEIEPNKKCVKALVKCICMNPYVWQTETITEDIQAILNWIDEYPYDYLIYIDLQNRPAITFVQKLIDQSSYKSLYKFIRLNYYYLKNNTEVNLIFPERFIQKVQEEMINLMNNQGNKNEMESFTIENVIRVYDVIGIFDDNLKQQFEKFILTQQSQQVTQLLRSSEQLRTLLLNSESLRNLNESNRYVDIMLNKIPNIKDATITTIQDILDAHSKGVLLSGFEQKQLKQQLIAKLSTIKEFPTPQQAYELVMGFKYTDFDSKTYLLLLTQIKNKIDFYDYHHIHKLITKLIDNKLIHAGIFYKCYLKLQRTFQTQLKDQKHSIYIIKLALLIKRLNPDFNFQISHQESEEGIFIEQIILAIQGQKCKQIKFDHAWTMKYLELYPFFYDDFRLFEIFKDKLQVALSAYIRGHKFKLDVNDIQKELGKPAQKLLVQLKLACLISMLPTRETPLLQKLKSNLLQIDPETNHLLQDQQVILFTVLKDLYPNDSINRRFESLVKSEMSNFDLPTIQYFLSEPFLTIRTISQMEDICLN